MSFDGYDGPGRLTISTSNQLIHGHGRPVALLGKDDSFDGRQLFYVTCGRKLD